MTDFEDQGVPQEASEQAPIEEMPVEEPRRAASLTLRTDEARESRAVSMEAANRSLADALRITYRLLQLVMIALVVLFLFSGFQQVNQAETGIRVDLGRIQSERLEPGFQFSWPYPIGEIIKVERGNRSIQLDESFWPELSAEERRRSISELGYGPGALRPGRDGALITGDRNLVHAQFTVVYNRANPIAFVRNLDPGSERSLIRTSVERAAVTVVATTPIEDLLKRGLGGDAAAQRENSVEAQVRRLAQDTLDTLESGLQINQVLLRAAIPPLRVRQEFDKVQSAEAESARQREQALGERNRRLNEIAGSAHLPLLDLIDKYEAALELNDEPEADRLLDLITDVLSGRLDGQGVAIDGVTYDSVRLSGEVSAMLSDARQYSSTVVQRSQRQAETFRVKLEQYRANPRVFLSAEWSEAITAFIDRPTNEVFLMPEDTILEILGNSDPDLARQRETERYTRDVEANPRLQQVPR